MSLSMISRNTWILICLILSLSVVARYLAPLLATDRLDARTPTPEIIALRHAALEGQGAITATPEVDAEERMIEQNQVETAATWLQDPNSEQRVSGAEQLSAYPTKEAEDHLVAALRNDTSAEVRAAAARALDYLERWGEWTTPSLLDALDDPDEAVRFNAFSSLQGHYYRLGGASQEADSLLGSLHEHMRSTHTPLDTRQWIRELLDDVAG